MRTAIGYVAIYALATFVMACVIYIVTTYVFIENTVPAVIMFDYRQGNLFGWPLSIQNVMWIVFAISLADSILNYINYLDERQELDKRYLPEDDETILMEDDFDSIVKRLHDNHHFLPELIKTSIFQFRLSKSLEMANLILSNLVELRSEQIEIMFSRMRYLLWLIPTLGFLGTVVGISAALSVVGAPSSLTDTNVLDAWMKNITGELGVAFYTTALGLVQASIIYMALGFVENRFRLNLVRTAHYCANNLINRIYVGSGGQVGRSQ